MSERTPLMKPVPSQNQGSRTRRPSRNNNRRPSSQQNFDSNGPGVRLRGTAEHICEKYLSLARDARGSGDWILAENLLQHAEHYQRLGSFNDDAPSTANENPALKSASNADKASNRAPGDGNSDGPVSS